MLSVFRNIIPEKFLRIFCRDRCFLSIFPVYVTNIFDVAQQFSVIFHHVALSACHLPPVNHTSLCMSTLLPTDVEESETKGDDVTWGETTWNDMKRGPRSTVAIWNDRWNLHSKGTSNLCVSNVSRNLGTKVGCSWMLMLLHVSGSHPTLSATQLPGFWHWHPIKVFQQRPKHQKHNAISSRLSKSLWPFQPNACRIECPSRPCQWLRFAILYMAKGLCLGHFVIFVASHQTRGDNWRFHSLKADESSVLKN